MNSRPFRTGRYRAAASALAAAVGVLVVAASLASCGFERKKQEAQLLLDAAKKAERVGTGKGTLAMSVSTVKLVQGFNSAIVPVRNFSAPAVGLQLDFAQRRASVTPPSAGTGPPPAEPAGPAGAGASAGLAAGLAGAGGRFNGASPPAVFVGNVVFLQRPGAANAAAGDSESQFGVRSWSKLDFAKVGKKDHNNLGGVSVVNPINPAYLVRMLAGTLSGSVRRVGTEQIGGVPTTHFTMNVDRTKAFSRLGDKDRQAVNKAFRSYNVKGDVYKHAEVWIDAAGLPRRFVLRVHQELDQDAVFGITYTIDLTDFGGPIDIHPPSADATAEVRTLNALMSSVSS